MSEKPFGEKRIHQEEDIRTSSDMNELSEIANPARR